MKKQGKTRFVGIASHSDTEEALKAATESMDIARLQDVPKEFLKAWINDARYRVRGKGCLIIVS